MTLKSGERILNPVEIAPDGPQGAKATFGFVDDLQLIELKMRVQESGKGVNLKNISKIAKEMGIPRVDS